MARKNRPPQQSQKDKQLEAAGLLNYQTKGLSQQEIAARYAKANVQVNEKWFNEQYKGQPTAPTQPVAAPSNIDPQVMKGGYGSQYVPAPLTPPTKQPSSVGYESDPVTGLTVKTKMPTIGPHPASPYDDIVTRTDNYYYKDPASGGTLMTHDPSKLPTDPNFIQGATVDDALKGNANWTDVSVNERNNILADPNFYKDNAITKYPKWMQQQIIADPSFDWKQLPTWQRIYFEASSRPAVMGAVQGAVMGGGNPGGAIAGGLLGGTAGWAGYDQTKEWWKQGDGKFTFDKQQVKDSVNAGFGLMNWLAEQAEKTVGLGFQVANAAVDPKKQVSDLLKGDALKDTWNAGANFFEVLAPAYKEVVQGDGLTPDDALKIVPAVWVLTRLGELIKNPEKYKGSEIYLGANEPVKLEDSWIERLEVAKKEISAGRDYREVMTEMQTGIMAQIGDMAGQGIADPLNVMPRLETKVGAAIAEVGGNKVATESLNSSGGLVQAAQKYKSLVQTGQALTIDPAFKVDQMGWFSRMVAGVNKQGEVKAGSLVPSEMGLLDPVKNKSGFLEEMTSQTPHSRAQTGAGMFYENIGTLLTQFEDPHEAGKYLGALSKGDNDTWSQLGSRFADSPEFYTILPALKAFSSEKLEGIVQAWDMTAPNRDMLTRLADVLGDNPSRLLDDLAKRGTSEQDFTRITERLRNSTSPEAKALLAEIESKQFNADTLKQVVDVFTGDGALPWHPGQWKAQMLDTLGSHFDEWVTKRLMLDKSPEAVSAFFRTTALMKQAQSILLLGGSPGYAITNGLSNMVHRAATGIYGYLTPNQINSFMDRMGVTPARFEEGVGIGGQIDMASGVSKVKTEAMSEAIRGKGALTTAKDVLGKISKGMPFSKLSSWFEKNEGRNAFTIAMKQFWSQSWRRGVGFSKMDPNLVKAISDMGVNPERIYAAIEAGMNQTEIEKALFGRYEGVQARSLVNDAAQRTGMTASQAADLLDKIGVLDTLDSYLKGQTSRDGVNAAFARANKQAQDWVDMQTGEDLKAIAESVKQRVGLEGAASALDVTQKATSTFIDTWMDHYSRFGEVMSDLSLLDDADMRNKAIDLNYKISDDEFRRVYARHAANYQGIFEAWGLSKNPDALNVLAAIGEGDAAMRDAYRGMREIRKGFFEKYRNDWDNPGKWDEWDANNSRIDAMFKRAFADKHQAEVKQGQSLGKIYESLYGPAAGEAARKWWEDVVQFNDEMVKREQDFRKSLEGMTKEEREAAKQKYYGETKIMMIAEVEKINGDGIARLERVIKKGGGSAGNAVPTDPAPAPGSPAADVNALLAAAEQRKGQEAKDAADRLTSIWDVAENFDRVGLPYDRTILQDKFALLGALRKPEYGGLADLAGLNDPRLTPEMVQSVMDARRVAKEIETTQQGVNQVVQAVTNAQDAASNVKAPKIGDSTSILKAISEHGGIDKLMAKDLTGEKRPKTAPGVFTNKGVGIDEMARMLADDGYPIDLDDPNDTGGIQQATALIERARRGDKVYPIAHDHEAMLARAQDLAAAKAFNDSFDLTIVEEVPFDQALWQTEFADTIARADLSKMYEMIGEFPEELSTTLTPDGETFIDFMSRVADETAARVEADARDFTLAESKARADAATFESQVRGEAVTTRNLLKEKFQDAFGLSEEQSQAYMELSDSVAGWYQKVTGDSADAFYSRYYEDVVKADPLRPSDTSPKSSADLGEDALNQIEPINRKMTDDEVDGYARALVRAGESDLRSAIRNEASKADRVAILDAAHKLDPNLAESVAKQNLDILFQNRKGAVTFDQEGIKATIHAFEAKDFSTLIHENGHVFRRVLKDVAERTSNPRIARDLATIEDWAGVKDGVWDRAAEEKFARGFEQYITDGKAPTVKLKLAFEMFKSWMLEIYKTITGTAIDVKMGDDIRAVFDRMLGGEQSRVLDLSGADRRQPAHIQLREAWTRLDADSRLESMEWILQKTLVDPLSGLETLVAKEIEGQKPDGWIEGMSDLNALKAINDTWGHEAGNAVINALGRIAAEEVEKVGGRAFRVGGDEISYWFPTEEAAQTALAEIDTRLQNESIVTGGQTRKGFTVSYGYGLDEAAADAMVYTDKERRAGLGQRADRGVIPVSIEVVDALKKIGEQRAESSEQGLVNSDQALFQEAAPIDTPAFRNWFGKSKVVDRSGRPLVVYHGTNNKFDTFFTDKTPNAAPGNLKGYYFANDKGVAGEYGNQIVGVYLSLKKPFYGSPFDYYAKKFGVQQPTWGSSKDVFEKYNKVINAATVEKYLRRDGYDGVIRNEGFDEYLAFEPNQIKSTANRGTFDPRNPNIFFQEADQPFGTYDAASQFHPQSEALDQGWSQYVRPLMDAMQEGALQQLNERPLDGATRDMSPEGQTELRNYMRKVQNEMSTTKLATIRHGERKRDFAQLNYSKRYGFDRVTETVMPYQFYQTRTMFNWGLRALDKPAFYSNYARLHNQTNRYERDIPERLRGKIKIPAPWMPGWMGDSMYIDPIGQLFPPASLLKPFERMMQDTNFQQIEAERILQEWAADGQYSQTEIQQAAQTRSGTIWERAFAEAQMRRESEVNNPIDFFSSMFGPAWYLTTPMSLAGIKAFPNQGDPSKITSTPLYNTIRGIDTVTQGTWAEPVGNLIGMLGKPEEWARKKLNLPEFGEYGDYYIDRQIANMVAEGMITPEQAKLAMIERQGDTFTQAQERVKMELAMRVPTMGALYAGLHEGPKAGAQAFLPSLFGAGLLPAGELEYRGLKQEWNEAWSQVDKGNKGAINRFFEQHPEYEAYLAKGKEPEERLRSFLVGQIWDGYMELGTTNQKQARAEMGELFKQSFLDKETRSYDTLDVDTLTQWAQMLGQMVPKTNPSPSPNGSASFGEGGKSTPKLNLYDPAVTDITDQFFEQRSTKFPNYYEEQAGYFALPKSERTAYLFKHPDLKAYWDFKDGWYQAYPQYKPIFTGDVFDRVDTSGWPPALEDYVRVYAMTGKKLPSGAAKSLEQVWISEGQPMGDFKSWLNSTVVPGMLYGEGQEVMP